MGNTAQVRAHPRQGLALRERAKESSRKEKCQTLADTQSRCFPLLFSSTSVPCYYFHNLKKALKNNCRRALRDPHTEQSRRREKPVREGEQGIRSQGKQERRGQCSGDQAKSGLQEESDPRSTRPRIHYDLRLLPLPPVHSQCKLGAKKGLMIFHRAA